MEDGNCGYVANFVNSEYMDANELRVLVQMKPLPENESPRFSFVLLRLNSAAQSLMFY